MNSDPNDTPTHHHAHSHSHGHHDHDDLVHHNQQHFDSEASNWDNDSEVAVTTEKIWKAIQSNLPLDPDSTTVLNFGCGTGSLEAHLRSDVLSIVGLDISKGMITKSREKQDQAQWTNVTFYQHDLVKGGATVPAALSNPHTFHLVLSVLTFHHLADITTAGKKLVEHVAPGGCFCLFEFLKDDTEENTWGEFVEQMSEATKKSIGTHDGFSIPFLTHFFSDILDLTDIHVVPIFHLQHKSYAYPIVMAWGTSKLSTS